LRRVHELSKLGLDEARRGLRDGSFSACELIEASLEQIEIHAEINAFITVTPDRARSDARCADRALRDGTAGPLAGLPIAVKDMFCTRGVRTTAGSRILRSFMPTYESAVTDRLWTAGAALVGKTNMDEFAMGSSTLASSYGPVLNPAGRALAADRAYVAGGSSGGSAAAVAAGIVPAAIGTDTGGSIRQPASFCGIVGLKPTYGRCSRWGIIAYASSLDQAGPMARTVRDAAIMLSSMAAHDERDSTSARLPASDFEPYVGRSVKGLSVGIPVDCRVDGLRADVEAMWSRSIAVLQEAGVQIREVSLPLWRFALPAYYIIACAEASSNLARYDGVRYGLRVNAATLDEMCSQTRAEGFGAEVKRRIIAGTFALSAGHYDAYFDRAQRVRQLLAEEFACVMSQVDALLYPTSPIPAFEVANNPYAADPVAMYLTDVFTVTVNLLGAPAISVPFGKSAEGLPLGMQIVAPQFQEGTVLQLGEVLFQAAES
jgi:aspartyl-tRNA(Asn)/glutamyl-tRNA(Gln) amidotransferase subunit A